MNTPAFRLAGISSGLAARLPRLHLSRLEIALLGAAAVMAIAIVAFGFSGSDEPDPIETATVLPPRLETKAAGMEVKTATAEPMATTPAPTAAAPVAAARPPLLAAPASSPVTGHFEKPAPTTAAGPDERGSETVAVADISAPATSETPDASDTASIMAEGLRGTLDVQVAETEAEIAMLEASTGMVDANAVQAPLPDMSPAKAAKYANLRDGPADEAKVIVVVPANAAIEAETGCNWCTVVYNGQRGYMFKSLIRRSVKEEAAAGQGLF
ncbi:SH3 domain-containing protein [Aminobacter anthyllidis]|uniref:SH3 domain-containing protein n=1 Tax=Aminobacter anthyllidis TaxID=1035067 RepID=A0A9X1ADD8_9HYPH|nr:SH3 domain-containing protein [Aminobacter anthyllidis]MBT1157737.1 SH3 domain-containing protein [Aminobacter anthyllidis]